MAVLLQLWQYHAAERVGAMGICICYKVETQIISKYIQIKYKYKYSIYIAKYISKYISQIHLAHEILKIQGNRNYAVEQYRRPNEEKKVR